MSGQETEEGANSKLPSPPSESRRVVDFFGDIERSLRHAESPVAWLGRLGSHPWYAMQQLAGRCLELLRAVEGRRGHSVADLVDARWGTAPGTAAPWRFWSRWGLQRTACGSPRRFGVEHVKVHGVLLVGVCGRCGISVTIRMCRTPTNRGQRERAGISWRTARPLLDLPLSDLQDGGEV